MNPLRPRPQRFAELMPLQVVQTMMQSLHLYRNYAFHKGEENFIKILKAR